MYSTIEVYVSKALIRIIRKVAKRATKSESDRIAQALENAAGEVRRNVS